MNVDMNCAVCGRYIGNMQVVWDTEPETICSEACAEKRTQEAR